MKQVAFGAIEDLQNLSNPNGEDGRVSKPKDRSVPAEYQGRIRPVKERTPATPSLPKLGFNRNVEKPSFIKGDINIDPEKCQGFFSRGSITFEPATVAGEPSRVSIEYDEEMSKYLHKIMRKKSRLNERFIYLRNPLIITDENVRYVQMRKDISF